VARATPALLARIFPPARSDGQGAAFASAVAPWAWAVTLLMAALAAGGALAVVGLGAAAAVLGAVLALARFLCGRLGGVTGDVFGAAIEAAELMFILGVLAWIHARP
jgi:adenosylcobinamide-GDP ribazoletransferase